MKIFLCLLIILMVSVGFARKVEIRLDGNAKVLADKPVILNSIVASSSDQVPSTKSLLRTQIHEPLKNDEKIVFSRLEMAKLLSEVFGSENASFVIPEKVILQASSYFIPYKDVLQEIFSKAESQCKECEISLREIKVPNMRGADPIQDWELDFSRTKLNGSLLIPLRVINQKGETSNYWVTGFIEYFKSAPVARRFLQPNQRIDEKDYEVSRVNVTYLKSDTASEQEIKGQMLNRGIAAGQPILVGDLKKEHSVVRGQMVRVLIGQEGFEISSQALAEDNGYVGDLVKLKTVDNNKLISGKVVEKGVVRLQ